MANFFSSLQDILSAMGPTVMLPIIIFLLGLLMAVKPGRALRAGVTIGIAFVGINLVIGLMWGALAGVSEAIVLKTGVQLTAVDVGWPVAAAIAFGSSVGTFIIPLSLLVNIILLVLGLTQTLNIDVWNFWHFAFVGSLVVVITGNLVLGLAAAAVASMLALFIADWTAKGIQEFYSLPGISITTASSQSFVIPAIPVNKLLDRIPGVNEWKADPESIQKNWGVIGEPVILGLVLGLILGGIAYLPPGEGANWTSAIILVLQTGVNLAAVMLLLPRMVAILMEGLIPISEGARDFMSKRFPGRDLQIGLDAAILIGHPSSIAASLILVPITILLAIILPGNKMMPFTDLAALPFMVCMLAPLTRGNVVRMIILGTLGAIGGLYLASWMAPLQTTAAQAAGVAIPEGATLISNVGDGWVYSVGALVAPAALGDVAMWIWLAVVAAVIVFVYTIFNKNKSKWSKWAGALED
jgi:PTS system galactitol-specific IIC component